MVERHHKCTLCHALFRTESGMMGHVSRSHEAPQALEALGKTYDGKLDELRKENATQAQEIKDLKTKLEDTRRSLSNTTLLLIKEQEKNVTLMLQIRNMDHDQRRLVIAYVVRDQILKERYGVTLPDPFGEPDNNPQTPIQHSFLATGWIEL